MKLVNTVRDRRRHLDLTQATLGERVGVSRQTIIAIEGGDYVPSALLAARLAQALGASFEDLFRVEGDSVS